MLLTLVDGLYEETVFAGNTVIVSTILRELQLTVEQILNAGESTTPSSVKSDNDED
jgi:hypothetical protein